MPKDSMPNLGFNVKDEKIEGIHQEGSGEESEEGIYEGESENEGNENPQEQMMSALSAILEDESTRCRMRVPLLILRLIDCRPQQDADHRIIQDEEYRVMTVLATTLMPEDELRQNSQYVVMIKPLLELADNTNDERLNDAGYHTMIARVLRVILQVEKCESQQDAQYEYIAGKIQEIIKLLPNIVQEGEQSQTVVDRILERLLQLNSLESQQHKTVEQLSEAQEIIDEIAQLLEAEEKSDTLKPIAEPVLSANSHGLFNGEKEEAEKEEAEKKRALEQESNQKSTGFFSFCTIV